MDTDLGLGKIVGSLWAWVTASLTEVDWTRCFLKSPLLFTWTSSHHYDTLCVYAKRQPSNPGNHRHNQTKQGRAATHLPECSEIDVNAGGARRRRWKILYN